MNTLNANWIFEKHIDFEYKKYVLLAYLQVVEKQFLQNRLYPCFKDIIEHYKNTVSIKEKKEKMLNAFPKVATGTNFHLYTLQYESIIKDDELMEEIETIIDYAIPKFEKSLSEGKEIYDFVEEHLLIAPVGILPLNKNEGYLLLKDGGNREAWVYEYKISIFETPEDTFRGIHTKYLSTYTINYSNTIESIKTEIIRTNKNLPTPATYVIQTDLTLPIDETFLPVAKQILVKYVTVTEETI